MLEAKCVVIENGMLCGEPVLADGVCYDHGVPCTVCGEPISKLKNKRVCSSCINSSVQMVSVYVWPDNTWVFGHEYETITDYWRGDDYTIKYVSEFATDEEVYKAILSK